MLPMMLMREKLKQSIYQNLNSCSLDLSLSSRGRSRTFEENSGGGFVCSDCGRTYKLKSSLRNHQKWECGKEPQFKCPYCSYRAKQKMHMARHLERMHKELDFSNVKHEMKSGTRGADLQSKDASNNNTD
ncbi:unnamed protein product [Acanthoscelides obtectus]|uniref:C2H2-type domain-containing protein n=1 Tax=Acanthoscelides obtectus TaxID=200917 RepID=A0A9P0P0P8_ACAOB|nr:unnamed protein product [Acanthoscelides obtectus]CAK1669654.1 Longitudinals lacking protein, isoforms A/B/D/L [Acanthoscelides obtectus]